MTVWKPVLAAVPTTFPGLLTQVANICEFEGYPDLAEDLRVYADDYRALLDVNLPISLWGDGRMVIESDILRSIGPFKPEDGMMFSAPPHEPSNLETPQSASPRQPHSR